MKTTRKTVFLSFVILASFLFAASSAFADVTYTNSSMPGETLVTGTGEGGVGAVTFNITGTNPIYYDGLISGAGAITKSGNGELILSGVSSGYSGAVNVNTGTLTLASSVEMSGTVSVNNESIFKCGATNSGISNLTVNGGTFMVGDNSNTAGNYLSDITLSSGFIEFDVNMFVPGASDIDLDLDYLYVNNGVLNNGAISLRFNNNDEMAWHDGAPTAGYPIIEAGASLTFNENSIKIYADGQQTDNWYLFKDGNSIYLKPKSSQPDPPDPPSPTDPWYYANSPTDIALGAWTINNSPKKGVKFIEGNSMTAEYGSADDPKTITMTKNGDFTNGEYQIGEDRTLTINANISGNAGLLKTEKGELILAGDNTYTGDTIVSDGTLGLNKDNAIATSANVTNNATIESTGDQKLNNLSGTNKDAEINADNGTLTLNNDANTNTRYDGTINGGASVRKIGVGTLMMTGENAYEGGTNIEEGEVVLLTDNEFDGTLGVGPIEIGQNGELVYNVDAGQTKKIENKISGAGTITKTGAGTLQAHGTDDMPLQAGSFNVEQGRLDLMGEFEGDVNVGPLDDNGNEVAAILSPGNSVGNVTIYGDVTIDAGATGLFEFSKYNNDPLLRSFDTLNIAGNDNTFTISDDAIVKLSFLSNDAYAWAEEGNEYQLVNAPGFADGDYSYLLSGYDNLFQLFGKNGNGLYLVGLGAPENPGVPEPSTWALLLLGAAGLYWMRRRK